MINVETEIDQNLMFKVPQKPITLVNKDVKQVNAIKETKIYNK